MLIMTDLFRRKSSRSDAVVADSSQSIVTQWPLLPPLIVTRWLFPSIPINNRIPSKKTLVRILQAAQSKNLGSTIAVSAIRLSPSCARYCSTICPSKNAKKIPSHRFSLKRKQTANTIRG